MKILVKLNFVLVSQINHLPDRISDLQEIYDWAKKLGPQGLVRLEAHIYSADTNHFLGNIGSEEITGRTLTWRPEYFIYHNLNAKNYQNMLMNFDQKNLVFARK